MLANGHEDLARHVSALLCSWRLILNVNSCCSLLNEELGQLHDGRETTVTRVGIGDNGSQVVDLGKLGALRLGRTQTLLALLAVVEELRHEEMADLVGDGGLITKSHVSTSNYTIRGVHKRHT